MGLTIHWNITFEGTWEEALDRVMEWRAAADPLKRTGALQEVTPVHTFESHATYKRLANDNLWPCVIYDDDMSRVEPDCGATFPHGARTRGASLTSVIPRSSGSAS